MVWLDYVGVDGKYSAKKKSIKTKSKEGRG
jgi:hypothetical protein